MYRRTPVKYRPSRTGTLGPRQALAHARRAYLAGVRPDQRLATVNPPGATGTRMWPSGLVTTATRRPLRS